MQEHFAGEADGVFGVGDEGAGTGAFLVASGCHHLGFSVRRKETKEIEIS